jgi:hypothetical protein
VAVPLARASSSPHSSRTFTRFAPRILESAYLRTARLTDDLAQRSITALGGEPIEVKLAVEPGAESLRCFWNVAAHIEQHGGSIVFGWSLHEWQLFWEAQHHAIWRTRDEQLVDITPPALRSATATIFVEDPASNFDHESGIESAADTQRFHFFHWPELRAYRDAGVNIRQRRDRLKPTDRPKDRMLNNYLNVERSAKEAILIQLANALGTDATCFCGSDALFADCCRSYFS